jgi:hypothetical protein
MALPGIDHLAHGLDIFSGTEFAAPIFRFTYCNTSDSHVLQDAYRWVSYQLPYQVNTGMKSLEKKRKKKFNMYYYYCRLMLMPSLPALSQWIPLFMSHLPVMHNNGAKMWVRIYFSQKKENSKLEQ